MRIAMAVLIVCLASFASLANPVGGDPTLFFDFDDNGVPDPDFDFEVYPPPYTTVSAYLAISCIDEPEEPFTCVSFLIEDPTIWCPGVMATKTFTSMLPGGLSIGDAFVYPGITCAATECMTDPVVYVGRIDMFYLGGACHLKLLDHGDYPRWVVDCQSPGQVNWYCDFAWGGIGTDHVETGEYCPSPTYCEIVPVEDVSWGAVKAMFR